MTIDPRQHYEQFETRVLEHLHKHQIPAQPWGRNALPQQFNTQIREPSPWLRFQPDIIAIKHGKPIFIDAKYSPPRPGGRQSHAINDEAWEQDMQYHTQSGIPIYYAFAHDPHPLITFVHIEQWNKHRRPQALQAVNGSRLPFHFGDCANICRP